MLCYQILLFVRLSSFRFDVASIFYYHLSTRRDRLHRLDIAGVVNQVGFHIDSISDFRRLS